jgi:flagellar hook protein FlgE
MSLSVELSGVQVAQTDLDTIGNNIANVSTTGFKSSTPNFTDVYATSLAGSAGASQGLGAAANSVSQLFTEGTIAQTGNPLDVAIDGNGFFQVQTGTGIAYSRDGALQLNANGYLTNDTGALVMGYGAPASGSTATQSGPLQTIQINQSNIAPTPTSNLSLNVNLPSSDSSINTTTTPFSVTNPDSYNESTTDTVYDSLGASHTLTTFFTQVSGSGSPPQWQTHWELSNSDGQMVASGAGATLKFNAAGALTAGSGTINVSGLTDGSGPLNIDQTFTGTTLSDLSFGVNSLANNGAPGGQYSGLTIGSNGNVIAQYTNGATKVMGTIALANFVNPQGLVATTNNDWEATVSSGEPVTNAPGTGVLGTLQSSALEGSNVDLSTQLVNLIVAQQAYQANVQGINVDQQDVQKLLTLQ